MSFIVTLKHIELLKTYANGVLGNSLEKYIKTGNHTFSDINKCRMINDISYIHFETFDIYNLILSEYIINGTKNLPTSMFLIKEEINGLSKIYNIEYKPLFGKTVINIIDGKYSSFTFDYISTTEYYFFKNSSEYNYRKRSKWGEDIDEIDYKLTKLGMYYFLSGYVNEEPRPNIILFDNAYNRMFYKRKFTELDSLNVIDSNRINYNNNRKHLMFNTTKGYNSYVNSSKYNSDTMIYHIKNKHGIIKLTMICKNNITEVLSFRKIDKLYLTDIG